MTDFSLSRYERHIDVPEIGIKGQQKLFQSSALIIGLGGLGCPAALYLAAAGIGRLGLADADTVSLSNLQRQVLFAESDVGQPKVERASRRLRETSSVTDFREHSFFLTRDNAKEVIDQYDLVLDCTDNFDTRYLVNHACHAAGKKLVSASVYHHDGQLAVFDTLQDKEKPCYQCLYPRTEKLVLAPSCKEAGIVGPVAGILGVMQAAVALNTLLEIGEKLTGHLLVFNSMSFSLEKIRIHKRPDCEVCGTMSAQMKSPINSNCAI